MDRKEVQRYLPIIEIEVARLKDEIELLTEEAQSNVGSIVELKTQLARKMSVEKVAKIVDEFVGTGMAIYISKDIVKAFNEEKLYEDTNSDNQVCL